MQEYFFSQRALRLFVEVCKFEIIPTAHVGESESLKGVGLSAGKGIYKFPLKAPLVKLTNEKLPAFYSLNLASIPVFFELPFEPLIRDVPIKRKPSWEASPLYGRLTIQHSFPQLPKLRAILCLTSFFTYSGLVSH